MTAVSKVREIDEGFSFDLGNFHLNVIHLPGTISLKYFFNSDKVIIHGKISGHTEGSIGLVDQENGLLVTGDTLYQVGH